MRSHLGNPESAMQKRDLKEFLPFGISGYCTNRITDKLLGDNGSCDFMKNLYPGMRQRSVRFICQSWTFEGSGSMPMASPRFTSEIVFCFFMHEVKDGVNCTLLNPCKMFPYL